MDSRELELTDGQLIEQIVGYVNFSSGAPDPQFLSNMDRLFACVSGESADWKRVLEVLATQFDPLSDRSSTFSDLTQARAVLRLLREHFLPGYLRFHEDLLFHQRACFLFGPFFIGRACEAVLQQGPPWQESTRIVDGAIRQINDYIGHRPVAALESRRHEPYAHEWVRPVPLYVEGAGVASGPYHELIAGAIRILQETDEDILRTAFFDPSLMAELAVDPRAYDFDHPVNKRPNYHFGQWDPHLIDNRGMYRRFVIQQVTIDALTARLSEVDADAAELQYEASAVLAGTILMASGVSGNGPESHDSTVTLSSLLPTIAAYRDAFYDRLITRAAPAHRRRLEEEAAVRRQPFGGARQHLNAWLARRRASQLEHVHLARIFARMGHADAAARQSAVVPVASARMTSQIDCRLTEGGQAVEEGDLERAIELAREIVELLHRAIECGAVIDPWNILGFDAHFSLFPALENSVHDHRADELIDVMEQLFGFLSRIWSAAAADDRQDLCRMTRDQFQSVATWWRQFAAHEVSSVEAVDAQEVLQAAEHVAESLNLWYKGGAAAGDIRFWAPHAHMFDSPKAFSLVIEALLDRDDFVASMALLIHWLSEADRVSLERGDSSFHELAERWLLKLLQPRAGDNAAGGDARPWHLVRKFFDYLEANAGPCWEAPRFELDVVNGQHEENGSEGAFAEEADENLYGAAYEGMVYQDTTDDGVDGQLFDTGETTTDELTRESRRLMERLAFLSSLAALWKLAAVNLGRCLGADQGDQDGPIDCLSTIRNWIQHAKSNHARLLDLLETVRRYRIAVPGADPESLMQYDRQRLAKDTLLDRIVATSVDTSVVGQVMLAALAARSDSPESIVELAAEFGDDAPAMVRVMAAILCGDNQQISAAWPELMNALSDKTLLYVPLSKVGNVRQIVATRCRQCQLQDLSVWLPRQGMWVETCQLIETARHMERNNPVGPGAVTEFDELFKTGYRALVESLVASSQAWSEAEVGGEPERALAGSLEELTEVLLASWLSHSRTLRLSVLERISSQADWEQVVDFIRKYGGEIFTQRFFSLGNLRAILHQGVGTWLRRLEHEDDGNHSLKLLEDLDKKIPRREAEEHLSLVLEAIVENYGEYRDYNSTTTQSDRGEMLFTLLDFLRLRTEYDRVCWHLKPVILAHEILVRHKREKAARLWRRALTERIGGEANQYRTRLAVLQKDYAISMPTVADRLAEGFVRPMAIDRMRALVKPAMEEARRRGPRPVFELLEHETESLARESTGIGFDVPVWLLALEEEVEQARQPTSRRGFREEIAAAVPSVLLSRQQVQAQLDACAN